MCKIILVSIGAEILKGSTLNTNVHFLSGLLAKRGYQVVHHLVVNDEGAEMIKGIEWAFEGVDVVITTGGLGPTCDDLTKRMAVNYMGYELELNQEVADDLKGRFGAIPSIEEQAQQPKGALLLKNRVGTASGMVMEKGEKRLALLPGVPTEMKAMAQSELLPWLEREFPLSDQYETAEFYLSMKNESEVDPFLRELSEQAPHIEMGIYPAYGTLTVRFSSRQGLGDIPEEFRKCYEPYIYESLDGTIQGAIQQLLISKGKTLVTAESCTGGAISSKLTSIAGASEYFLGGIVSYSNEMKCSILGVAHETLDAHGAVSRETAIEMAQGALEVSGADYAISVTGIAGPGGGTAVKPVGLVFGAICGRGGLIDGGKIPCRSSAPRSVIVEKVSNYLLAALYRRIQFDQGSFK